MSEQAIRGALQAHLLTLGWETQTAWEGRGFTPAPGTPYQEVETAFFEALPVSLSGSDQARGVFQVRLLYPLTDVAKDGIGAPTARAEAIKAAFPRNLKLPAAGTPVLKISRAPTITRGPPQGDRDVTIVRIRFNDR